jgi:hypothetical protein
MQFTEHRANQGLMSRTMHKFGDEKELTRLRESMEEAFNRFKVRTTPHTPMPTVRNDFCQLESHIRIEKALRTLLTAAETGACDCVLVKKTGVLTEP